MAHARDAEGPMQVPRKSWFGIAREVQQNVGQDHIGLIAAGVAFYGLLALFPAITALMALAGLLVEPDAVVAQLDTLTQMMPEQAAEIVMDQATSVAGAAGTGLGLAAAAGLLLTIYSASKGTRSLIEGMNVAYDEQDERGFFARQALVFGMTALLIIGFLVGVTVLFGLGSDRIKTEVSLFLTAFNMPVHPTFYGSYEPYACKSNRVRSRCRAGQRDRRSSAVFPEPQSQSHRPADVHAISRCDGFRLAARDRLNRGDLHAQQRSGLLALRSPRRRHDGSMARSGHAFAVVLAAVAIWMALEAPDQRSDQALIRSCISCGDGTCARQSATKRSRSPTRAASTIAACSRGALSFSAGPSIL